MIIYIIIMYFFETYTLLTTCKFNTYKIIYSPFFFKCSLILFI